MVFEAVECQTCEGVNNHRHEQSATGKIKIHLPKY